MISAKHAQARRQLLVRSGIAVASLTLVPLVAWQRRASAGTASREDFHYQLQPRDGMRCADCAAFVPAATGGEGSCRVVAGPISPDGWCMAFSKR